MVRRGTVEFQPGIRQNIKLSVPNLMMVDQIPIAVLCGSRDPIGQPAGGSCSRAIVPFVSGAVSSCFGSPLGSNGDFQAERFCRCRGPGFSAEGGASVDAAANGCQFGVGLRRINMLQPTGTAANWPCRQQFFFSRRSGVPAMKTAPTPVFRTFHQLRPQSIAFHIPAQRQKVVIALNRKRFESPLIQVTRTSRFAMSVPALRMSQCQLADKA